MFDKQNGPIRRSAFLHTSTSTCDVATGDEGTWNDGGVIKFRRADGTDTVLGGTVRVALTNAEILALRASPKTLVAAPGAGKYLEFIGATMFFDRAGAYTESADNLAIRFTDGSGTVVSETIETTGFVDAASDAVMPVQPAASAVQLTAACVNKALVLHNTGDGEFGGGNAANEIIVEISYRVHDTGF